MFCSGESIIPAPTPPKYTDDAGYEKKHVSQRGVFKTKKQDCMLRYYDTTIFPYSGLAVYGLNIFRASPRKGYDAGGDVQMHDAIVRAAKTLSIGGFIPSWMHPSCPLFTAVLPEAFSAAVLGCWNGVMHHAEPTPAAGG